MTSFLAFSLIAAAAALPACAPKPSDDDGANAGRFLYVSSGLCQAGSNTTFTATSSSNLVYRVNLGTGQRDRILADYNSLPASSGDTPVSIARLDSETLIALIERSGARRVEKIKKNGDSTRTNFSSDVTALSNTLLRMSKTSDGGFFISRTNGLTKLSSSGSTVLSTFSNNSPGGSCGTNNKYSDAVSTNKGHLIFSNSVSANARIGIILNTGGANCLAAAAAPTAAALPSAMVWIPEANQVLVAYSGSGTATDVNSIYAYEVTETPTTASFDAGTKIYDASEYPSTKNYLLYAVSAMTYDAGSKSLYISSAVGTTTTVAQYVIEKFRYDSTAKTIARAGTTPFYNYGLDTKCISGLYVD
ncbi:MAG TPA: hypothetical protein PL182_00920 [Pseudobdellovibrionaceae bacterium]|nr:hypothetical protein [Pseudobdellovibrionaceae bacterium]